MTRTDHHSHPTPQFPVYCLGFADDSTLLMGGGGGSSRTGILNKLKLCSASPDGKSLKVINEFQFGKEEDSPWSLAVDKDTKQVIVGVNASEASIKSSPSASGSSLGTNEHCRLLSFAGDDRVLKPVRAVQTITEGWSDDYPYQKLSQLNQSSTLLAIGTISTLSQRVSILTFPDLERVGEDIVLGEEEEMVDLDWSPDGGWLAITTARGINLYSLSLPPSEKQPSSAHSTQLTFRQTIYSPSLDIDPVIFRSAKFSRSPAPVVNGSTTSSATQGGAGLIIHAVLNNLPPKAAPRAARGGAKPAAKAQKAFVVNFGLAGVETSQMAEKGKEKEQEEEPVVGKWDVVVRREVGTKPVTVFEPSDDGRLLAYASSDYSIGVLDARTLAPLLKILHAHKFATTALAFNPSARLLASSSADHTVRLIVVPENFGGSSMTILAVVLSLILLIIAFLIQRRLS